MNSHPPWNDYLRQGIYSWISATFRLTSSASQQHIHDSRQCRDASCVHLQWSHSGSDEMAIDRSDPNHPYAIRAIRHYTSTFRKIELIETQAHQGSEFPSTSGLKSSDNGQPEGWRQKLLPIHRFRFKVLRPDAVENRMLRHLHLGVGPGFDLIMSRPF